jgi:hypothetical protein
MEKLITKNERKKLEIKLGKQMAAYQVHHKGVQP